MKSLVDTFVVFLMLPLIALGFLGTAAFLALMAGRDLALHCVARWAK